MYILFDVDGVLIKEEWSKYFWYTLVPKIYGKQNNIDFFKAKKIVTQIYKKFEINYKWVDYEFWREILHLKPHIWDLKDKILEKVEVYPDIYLLNKFKKFGKIGIATNNPSHTLNILLEKIPFKEWEIIFTSDKLKALKPENEYYNKIINKIGEDVVIIDDLYKTEVIKTFIIRKNGKGLRDALEWFFRRNFS